MIRTVLVVAKAPVAGLAKTRLIGTLTAQEAAGLAAAALLDTLCCAVSLAHSQVVVALTGTLRDAERAAELEEVLGQCRVVQQRGSTFAERLVAAHADAGVFGDPVLQVGMDTPQLTPELLESAFDRLTGSDAVLGPAEDGGWWALGVNNPADAEVLATVTMSTEHTGRDTLAALLTRGIGVAELPVLTDVDTWDDACRVSAIAPCSRFAAALAAVSTRPARGVA